MPSKMSEKEKVATHKQCKPKLAVINLLLPAFMLCEARTLVMPNVPYKCKSLVNYRHIFAILEILMLNFLSFAHPN